MTRQRATRMVRWQRAALVIIVLGSVMSVALPWYLDRYFEAEWLRRLDHLPSGRLSAEMRRAARRGDEGLKLLAASLDSGRQEAASAAKRVLLERLDGWQSLPPADAQQRRQRLADLLEARVHRFEAAGRQGAADVAAYMLLTGASHHERRLLRAIDRVLVASGASMPQGQRARVRWEGAAATGDASGNLIQGHGGRVGGKAAGFTPDRAARLAGGGLLPGLVDEPPRDFPGLPAPGDGDEPRALVAPRPAAQGEQSNGEPATDQVFEEPQLVSAEDDAGDTRPSATETVAHPRGSVSRETTEAGPVRWTELAVVELFEIAAGRSADSRLAVAELAARGVTQREIELGGRVVSATAEERIGWVGALPGLRLDHAEQWLLWLSHDSEAEVRRAVISILATSNDARLLGRIEQMGIEDPDAEVRHQAARFSERARRLGNSRR